MSEEPEALTDVTWFLAPGQLAMHVDETLFPLDAIYGAAYLFVDRCYIFLHRPAERLVEVRLKAKPGTAAAKEGDVGTQALEQLAGELSNELLNQVLRVRVGQSTARLREYTLARAFFSGGPATSSIDALLAELDAEELEEAPLDVDVPWATPAAAEGTPPAAGGSDDG